MTTLCFDTSSGACCAALVTADDQLHVAVEEMARGQAERLFPMLEDLLLAADVRWTDLGRIGVGVGPGNFTGIRISVAAARGLALALNVPCVGVSGFDVIHATQPDAMAAIHAPRGFAYLARRGETPHHARLPGDEDVVLPPPPDIGIARMVRLAAAKPVGPPPAPLYLKPADAAPARDIPPVILDDA